MVCLKDHLLREIADDLCRRWEHNPIKSIPPFLLAGKEPAFAILQIVGNAVVHVFLIGNKVDVGYCVASPVQPPFMKILLLKWVRKLNVETPHDWLQDSSRPGLLKLMCENEDIRSLSVNEQSISSWPKLFKLFPKLIFVNLKTSQFDEMLLDAPNELINLQEICFDLTDGYVDNVCLALFEHQAKLPSLKAVSFQSLELSEVDYRDTINFNIVLPTIKHLTFAFHQHDMSFDFNFLTATQKVFPSLETVDIDVKSSFYQLDRDVEDLKKFYEEFRSLNFKFFICMHFRDEMRCDEKHHNEVRSVLASQGTVSQERKVRFRRDPNITETTILPGKSLIRELFADIFVLSDSSDEFYGSDY